MKTMQKLGFGSAIVAFGTAYSIRMGVESSSVGADCFFGGDAPTVDVSCIEVRLSIR